MSKAAEPVVGQETLTTETQIPDSKGLGGRPPKVDEETKQLIYQAFETYIYDTADPTVADFVTSVDICKDNRLLPHYIYNNQEFSELIKIGIAKQEAYLLKNGGNSTYNPTLAIFRLKQPQHGYRDRQEITGDDGKDLIPEFTSEQAEQLLKLRAKRASTSK